MAPRTDAQEVTGGAVPGSVTGTRRLNNFVTELLNLSQPDAHAGLEWRFNNPRDGWVFARSTASVQIGGRVAIWVEAITPGQSSAAPQPKRSSDAGKPVLVHEKTGEDLREGMRYLLAGQYKARLEVKEPATPEGLVVRAIPELIFCKFQYDPFISPLGPYDWAFVQKHVATNANCIVGSGAAEHR